VSRDLRVCVLTTGFPRFTGDLFGSFVLELVGELARNDVHVEVIAPHEQGLQTEETVGGVHVRRFRYALPTSCQRVAYGGGIPTNLKHSWWARAQVPLFLISFWWRAARACRQSSLFHCQWTITGFVAYMATRVRHRPLVLSVRGSDIHLMQGGVSGLLNRKIYRWMDMIIAVSHDIAAKLEQIGVDPGKIRVVENGVDGRFHPRSRPAMREQLDLPQAAFIMLFVGLLVPVKGLDVLVEAMGRMAPSEFLCVLVGDGQLRNGLQEQAERAGLSNQIRFMGQRPSAEVPLWMCAADALVLPSRSEGRPNVVLEAQACGVPVVATRVGGTPELVEDGRTGMLVEPEDPVGLASALGRLADDARFRQSLGRCARSHVERSGLTWERSASKVMDIYKEALSASRG